MTLPEDPEEDLETTMTKFRKGVAKAQAMPTLSARMTMAPVVQILQQSRHGATQSAQLWQLTEARQARADLELRLKQQRNQSQNRLQAALTSIRERSMVRNMLTEEVRNDRDAMQALQARHCAKKNKMYTPAMQAKGIRRLRALTQLAALKAAKNSATREKRARLQPENVKTIKDQPTSVRTADTDLRTATAMELISSLTAACNQSDEEVAERKAALREKQQTGHQEQTRNSDAAAAQQIEATMKMVREVMNASTVKETQKSHVPILTLYLHQMYQIVATFLHIFDSKAISVPRPHHMQTCLQNSHKK